MIALRAVEPADVEVFYEQQADPVAADMAAFPARDRAAHLDHWARRVLGDSSVATEAVRLYLREVDERPVYAYVANSTVGSRLVLEKNGFVLAADQPPPDPQDVEELLFVLN